MHHTPQKGPLVLDGSHSNIAEGIMIPVRTCALPNAKGVMESVGLRRASLDDWMERA